MLDPDRPTILVYRRTHTGDPDKSGVFGCNGCMGSVRAWDYDAVIGVGGVQPWPECEGIARKLNWIGIGPKRDTSNTAEPLVTFSKFISWDEKGVPLSECAPKLNEYMFTHGRIPRAGKSFPDDIYQEILQLLTLASDASPSKGNTEEPKTIKKCASFKSPSKHSRGCS